MHSDNLKLPCQCLSSSVVKHVAVHVSFPHFWAPSVSCSNDVLSSPSCRPSPHFVLYNIFLATPVCACVTSYLSFYIVCVCVCTSVNALSVSL